VINDRPGSLVNLLTYLFGYQTSVALISSRRQIGVNGLVETWVSPTKIEFWWKIVRG